MAGVPFETLEKLSTTETAQAARELIARQADFSRSKSDVEEFLAVHKHDLPKEQFRIWRKAIRSGVMPLAADPPSSVLVRCWQSAAAVATAEAALDNSLAVELGSARAALLAAARRYLSSYLIFAGEGVRERVVRQLASAPVALPPRNKQARANERHLVLYLQRVAGKNDSLSEFGPEGWGTIEPGNSPLELDPQAGIARRETFLERWAAHGAAAAINSDPQAGVELAPRLHPDGRIEENHFLHTATGEKVPLDRATLALLARCDGMTPAHSLGVEMTTLEALARQNLIRWEMEVPALEAHAFDLLVADVAGWRDGPVRTRWLDQLQPLAALPEKFARAEDPLARLAIIGEATERLEKLGAHKTATRFLYSATNPIGEECFRECNFSISEDLINEVADEAAPWIDLWRDNYAFVASRVAAGLRGLLAQAPLQNGALPLPAFLHHCANLHMPLTGPGMIAFAHNAFQEVKAAFQEKLQDRADQPEYELTAADCQFVREKFTYESFDEYTYPSADLQLGAKSVAAVARGEYQWVLAELHPSVALLHYGFYWSCPDKTELNAALNSRGVS